METVPVTNPIAIVANQETEALSSHSENDSKENKEVTHVNQKGKLNQPTVFYRGFYFYSWLLPNIMAFQQHFQPLDTDIIVATKPKCGTTWLKSLVYSIVHRTRFTNSNHPLLTKNPHQLIRNLEFTIYSSSLNEHQAELLTSSSPRLFSTHLPYDILPESIKHHQSKCKIVFMARNPFDTVVSYWKFLTHNNNEDASLEDYVESFCRGEEVCGPFWDHVIGYWKRSLEEPNKVLFLKYEDMQDDGVSEMKKLAEFIGYGFSGEEEKEGVIQDLLMLCSIDNLKNLEVNKTGMINHFSQSNSSFFRKGKVGDWINHLSPAMVERLDRVMTTKFVGSGLEFRMSPKK